MERMRTEYEKRRKPLSDATPKSRVIGGGGSTFSIFNLHAWDHYDQTSLT